MDPKGPRLPASRQDELVVETMADETLVYDLRRHRAHYLNPTAALVWRSCRERRSMAETVRRLADELGTPAAEPLVWMALDRLDQARLLTEPPAFPGGRARYSRRQVIRTLGLSAAAALLLPLVDSIVSPVAAQAGSCLTSAQCEALSPPACTGQPICGDPRNCCVQRGHRCRDRKC
jgi:hypothetical protein